MGDDTNITIFLFGGVGVGGSRRIPGKMSQDTNNGDKKQGYECLEKESVQFINRVVMLKKRKHEEENPACLDAAASKKIKEEFTTLHKIINNQYLSLALKMLKDVDTLPLALLREALKDASILAIAPRQGKIGPGNSALHFLATAGGSNDVDKNALQALADTLCQLCKPLLNHRNEGGLMALHTAAAHGNHILVKALLVAGAGFIFTFILNYSYS